MEKLTIWQPYSSEQLKALVPEGAVYEHVVFRYTISMTAEWAYIWTKQILQNLNIQGTCILVIHFFTGIGFHVHVLIPPQNEFWRILSSDEEGANIDNARLQKAILATRAYQTPGFLVMNVMLK